MLLNLLKSKIHRVSVTACELHYEGSCAIDSALLDAADIREYEQVHIYNIANGNRFTTYAIKADKNSGIISLNGAAAHKADIGDLLVIATYSQYTEDEYHRPVLCYVDEQNKITKIKSKI